MVAFGTSCVVSWALYLRCPVVPLFPFVIVFWAGGGGGGGGDFGSLRRPLSANRGTLLNPRLLGNPCLVKVQPISGGGGGGGGLVNSWYLAATFVCHLPHGTQSLSNLKIHTSQDLQATMEFSI